MSEFYYLANYNGNNVSVVSKETNEIIETVTVGANPISLLETSDGKFVYVSNFGSNDISVISTDTNKVITTIGVGGGPDALAITPDGTHIYVTNWETNDVSVISTDTNTLINMISVGTNPDALIITSDGTRVYVVNFGSNDVSVISTETQTVMTRISVGDTPDALAITPDNTRIYVVNFGTKDVSVISTDTNKVVNTIDFEDIPDEVEIDDSIKMHWLQVSTQSIFVPTEAPVVLVEPTLQIVVESNITLFPAATEIKKVKKNVFLEQVKLVPVTFVRIDTTDFFNVTRAKIFVAGHIRKNIEYASHECNGVLQNRIVDVPFTGFTDITPENFINSPIIGIAEGAEANFLNEKTNMDARMDKYFFQNLVKYNEQPYGELVAANFFELDFSPTGITPDGTFTALTEKIVMDLTVRVLQDQQINQQILASDAFDCFGGYPGKQPSKPEQPSENNEID